MEEELTELDQHVSDNYMGTGNASTDMMVDTIENWN